MSQENMGQKTFRAGENLPAYGRVKLQSGTGDTVVLAQTGEEFIGVTAIAANAGEMVNVSLRSAARTYKMIAAGAINVGAIFYGADSGKIQAGISGLPQGIVLEAAASDGEIIECVLNNGAGGSINGATINIKPEASNGAIPILFSKSGIADATVSPIIVTAPFKFRVVHWWIVSRDTTAANIKLINNVTDLTAVIVKGATNDSIVAGGTILNAQKDVLAGVNLKVNANVAAAFDVYVMVVRV